MNAPLLHFIRPLTVLLIILAPAAVAGVSLQLDAAAETRARESIVRFVAHADTNSKIAPDGTSAVAELEIAAGTERVALEISPPAGSWEARLELRSVTGQDRKDNFQLALDPGTGAQTLMVELRRGAPTMETAAPVELSPHTNSQIIYDASKGLSVTMDMEVDLVLTPSGVDGIEIRHSFKLVGALTGGPVRVAL